METSVLLRQNIRTFAQRSPMFYCFRTATSHSPFPPSTKKVFENLLHFLHHNPRCPVFTNDFGWRIGCRIQAQGVGFMQVLPTVLADSNHNRTTPPPHCRSHPTETGRNTLYISTSRIPDLIPQTMSGIFFCKHPFTQSIAHCRRRPSLSISAELREEGIARLLFQWKKNGIFQNNGRNETGLTVHHPWQKPLYHTCEGTRKMKRSDHVIRAFPMLHAP